VRKIVALAALVSALGLVSVAAATPPTHTTNTFSASFTDLPGDFCDVGVGIDLTVTSHVTTFSNGNYENHGTLKVTYTNLGTLQALTGTAVVNGHGSSSGEADSGLELKLRDANGKVVSVNAGRVVYDSSFQVVSFTPNSAPDVEAVVCPALGANPA
jgi:hypothetical protein